MLPTLIRDTLNLLQNHTFHSQFIPVHVTKAYKGAEVLLHSLLSSALDGGEKSSSRPSRLAYG
jgi:hypothetical protein